MDEARLDELRRFWDEVARGVPAAPGNLDPELADTIRRLHALDDVPAPEPTYAMRLRESLLEATAISLPLADPLARPGPNGLSTPVTRRTILPPMSVSRGRWAVAQLATAALLLLTLIGSFLVFGPGRQERQDDVPVFIPAISRTPATPEAVRTETLLDTTVSALPAGRNMVAVDRWRLQPSPSAVILPAHEGTVLIAVDFGEITVTVGRSEHRLEPGLALDVANHEFALRASGSEPAVAYAVYVTPRFPGFGANRFWLSGDPLFHSSDGVISSSHDDLPGGPGRLVLERLTLSPGASLPPLEASPLVWTEVGSGILGLTLEGDRLPYRWEVGKERKYFQFGREILPSLAPGTKMMMRNAGDEPLVLYRLTIIPTEAGPSDAASPIATTAAPSG